MSIEIVITLFSGIIAGAITFVFTTFNKENGLYKDNKEKYFNNILKPYFSAYINNEENINPIDFFKEDFTGEDFYYIPGYIHYLKNEKKKDVLSKVLLVDYMSQYPSYKNSLNKSMDTVVDNSNVLLVLLNFLMVFPVMFLIIFSMPTMISEGINYITGNNYGFTTITILEIKVPVFILQIILLSILVFCISRFFYLFNNSLSKYDLYTYNKKYIVKTIKRRTKQYKKIKNNNIFINTIEVDSLTKIIETKQ